MVKCDPLEFRPGFDENAKDLINQLLQKDPENRIGALDIEDLKQHPFFASINWENIRHINPPYVSLEQQRKNRTAKASLS